MEPMASKKNCVFVDQRVFRFRISRHQHVLAPLRVEFLWILYHPFALAAMALTQPTQRRKVRVERQAGPSQDGTDAIVLCCLSLSLCLGRSPSLPLWTHVDM